MSDELSEVIAQRQSTHGDFRDVGLASQALRAAMRQNGKNWSAMDDYQREGLEMIQHKIARILSGQWDFEEHWLDIAGYATRVRTILSEGK